MRGQSGLSSHDCKVGRQLGLFLKGLNVLLHGGHKAQVVQHHGPQCNDELADLLESDVHRVL